MFSLIVAGVYELQSSCIEVNQIVADNVLLAYFSTTPQFRPIARNKLLEIVVF